MFLYGKTSWVVLRCEGVCDFYITRINIQKHVIIVDVVMLVHINKFMFTRLGMFDSYIHVVVLQSRKCSSMGILWWSAYVKTTLLSHIHTRTLVYSWANTVINKMVFGVSLENIHFGTWTRCTEPKMVIFGQCLSVCPCPTQASGLLNLVDQISSNMYFWFNIFIIYTLEMSIKMFLINPYIEIFQNWAVNY